MERLGLMGGTFDPVHLAHLAAAHEARHQLGLTRVVFVVAGDPWQKRGEVVASAADRVAMVEAAVADVDGFEVSRVEIDRPGPTYMIDTVQALRQPGTELVLILGADAAAKVDTWHRADELRDAVTLAVVGRDHCAPSAPARWRAEPVAMPQLEVSSTDIRRRIAAHAPFEYLMPPAAVRLVCERGLYTGP